MNLIKILKYCYYYISLSRKPFSIGYGEYREKEVNKILNNKNFNSTLIKSGYGVKLDERIIEYPWLFSRLPSGFGHLLDAGSTLNFEHILSQNVLAEKKITISTLSPEVNCFWKNKISYVFEDLRNSCFKDNYFDWIVSLSVVEHIGMDNTKYYTSDILQKENDKYAFLDFIKELNRIMKPGGILYLSVPYGKYHNHGWLQVFDAEMIDQLLEAFLPSSFLEHHFKYEKDGWRVSTREESEKCTYSDFYKNKKCEKDFAVAARGIACLELVK